jgi:hypothetical protein
MFPLKGNGTSTEKKKCSAQLVQDFTTGNIFIYLYAVCKKAVSTSDYVATNGRIFAA